MVLALNQGISQEMYPKSAIAETEKLQQEFEDKMKEDMKKR